MRNASVSLSDYASCVEAQVAFLVEHAGMIAVTDVFVTGSAAEDVRECYARGVTVDGCAAILVR